MLLCISEGINRPGTLLKNNPGLTTKVLNECLGRLIDYKILQKLTYPEIPPRVEYRLTNFGQELMRILLKIKELQDEFEHLSQS